MQGIQKRVERKAYRHIVLPLFIASILAFLDRVNVSYAALTMNQDLGFTAEVYGIGAGIFFAGYVIFEIPGALWAEKWSPSKWIARIMVTWGIVCMLMAFIENETQFFIYRFLLGACEASLYPVIYASVIPRWFLTADRPRAIALRTYSIIQQQRNEINSLRCPFLLLKHITAGVIPPLWLTISSAVLLSVPRNRACQAERTCSSCSFLHRAG